MADDSSAVAQKLQQLTNPAPPPAPAPPPTVQTMNLENGLGPLPGPGSSTTPGVDTGLTAEQQRALMFQGGA